MAREDLHFRLRIPENLKKKVEASAEANGQSMTAEIVGRLEQSFEVPVSLPQDLLTRIRLYAERQGRSVNEEILRLLEREYPEQWDVDLRMEYLADMLAILSAGKADPRIDQYIHDVQETVEGIVTGRVKGVSDKARNELSALWDRYQERMAEDAEDDPLDDEEREMYNTFGRTEKFAVPIPDPQKDFLKITEVLPNQVFADLTGALTSGDKTAAVRLLESIDDQALAEWIDEAKLDWFERERRRLLQQDNEEPPATRGEDPFAFTKRDED